MNGISVRKHYMEILHFKIQILSVAFQAWLSHSDIDGGIRETKIILYELLANNENIHINQ